MEKFSKYVDLDTHKDTIAVSVADDGGGSARYFGEMANSRNGSRWCSSAVPMIRVRLTPAPSAVAKPVVIEIICRGSVLCFCALNITT